MRSEVLREMIARTLFAVSTDETRLNLSGVLLEAPEEGKLRIVATDGHRLSMITRVAVEEVTTAGVIVPRKGVVEVSKVIEVGDEAVTIALQGGVAHASYGRVDLSMRLVEGEFPDYKQVVPQKSERRMLVGVEPLLSALRRVSVVSSERTRGVKLQLDGSAARYFVDEPRRRRGNGRAVRGVRRQSAEHRVQCQVPHGSAHRAARLRAGRGGIQRRGESRGAALRSRPDYLYVVMPMRL